MLEVNEDGVTVDTRPWASVVVVTPPTDVAVVSVDATVRELEDEGVTKRVDVLVPGVLADEEGAAALLLLGGTVTKVVDD